MPKKIIFVLLCCLICTNLTYSQNQSIQTKHGFRFINHTNGKGAKPASGESIMLHVDTYIGDTLMGSTHSYGGRAREYTIPELADLENHVPYLYDAALLMGAGDSATIYEMIDSTTRRFVPASQKDEKEIRYELKIEEVITKEQKAKKLAEGKARLATVQTMMQSTIKDYKEGKLDKKLVILPSGLKILIVEKGKGTTVKTGETARVNYLAALMDGLMFDNSYERAQTLDFAVGVGQMIPGFDEGVSTINHGSKAYFFVPSQLAYGEGGSGDGIIPAKADLVFYVELF